MGISENDIFVCDFCGEDTGKFNAETGNHVACEELAALRHLKEVASDVNEWLKNNGAGGTGHQRSLEAALAEYDKCVK